MAREENSARLTPMQFGVLENKINVLNVLLEHDFSLGYIISTSGDPLLCTAAYRGHVGVATELLKHCPDAPFLDEKDGTTCLHTAVEQGHIKFVEFVLQSKELRKLINMRDSDGETALHYAIRKCHPKIVSLLLQCKAQLDLTMLDSNGNPPIWVPDDATDHAKTLNWVRTHMLFTTYIASINTRLVHSHSYTYVIDFYSNILKNSKRCYNVEKYLLFKQFAMQGLIFSC